MSNRVFEKKEMNKKNALVIGTPGNIDKKKSVALAVLKMESSFVVTDPSGEVLRDTKEKLLANGYKVKVMDLKNMEHSCGYNPLSYIKDEKSASSMIDCMLHATSGEEKDEFFLKAEKLLYSACIMYLLENCKEENKKNMGGVLELVKDVYNKTADGPMVTDLLYQELPKDCMAAKLYKAFTQAAGKTKKEIAVSCEERITSYLGKVLDFTKKDELDLEKIGKEKTVLFIIPDTSDAASATLTSLVYTQAADVLCRQREADDNERAAEEIPVELIIDGMTECNLELDVWVKKMVELQEYNVTVTTILYPDITNCGVK